MGILGLLCLALLVVALQRRKRARDKGKLVGGGGGGKVEAGKEGEGVAPIPAPVVSFPLGPLPRPVEGAWTVHNPIFAAPAAAAVFASPAVATPVRTFPVGAVGTPALPAFPGAEAGLGRSVGSPLTSVWETRVSRTTGAVYYKNLATGEKTFSLKKAGGVH